MSETGKLRHREHDIKEKEEKQRQTERKKNRRTETIKQGEKIETKMENDEERVSVFV